VADAALAYLPADELLRELLERITEILGTDTAAVLLLDEAGGKVRARAAKGIEEEVEQGVEIPLGKGFAGRIAEQRRPIIIDDVDQADIHNPILREKGIRSLLGVPLLAEDRVLGVLHVGTLTPRHFTDDDRDLLQLAADRAAVAIQHASLYERERSARLRLEALQRVTDAALAYLPEEELLRELLVRICAALGTDTAAILLLDESGARLRARAAKGVEEEVEQGVEIPVGKGFAGRIAAERRPLAIEDVDYADILNPILREKGIRSLLGVPLLAEDRVLGVLHVGSLTPRRFTADERDLLQLAAGRAAIAIEHAALFERRRLADALQRRLLPDLGRVGGLELASRYLPAAGASLGGDWYDAFPLRRGRVALAAGDVVGHGVGAAAVMAQLRTALRAYALEGHPPAMVVERVNALLWELGSPTMTTLAFAVVDLERETLQVVMAGHPPALLIPVEGAPDFLPLQQGVPLGTAPLARYACDEHPFPTGSTVVLYTDGLVEERGKSIDAGLERLRSLAEGAGDVEALAERVVGAMVPREPRDDVVLLAARLPLLPARLRARWPADAHALAAVRLLLRRWLRAQGVSELELDDITIAAQEACTNAVEHAYGPGQAAFEFDAECVDRRVRIVVRDAGRWRAPRGTNRGRGLPIMQQLMDVVDIRQTDDGTEIVLERSLGAT
jgi:GAF domain-containing protein/anti-sigma regulatory factor (Ser/Thr protein kinase)